MKWIFLLLAMAASLGAQTRSASLPWWENPITNGVDLSEIQRRQINLVIRDFRNRLVDARAAVEKAENDLEDVFNEEFIDYGRGNAAIEELADARADLTRAMSEMTLRLRAVLTPDQWQELQRRERDRGRPEGRRPKDLSQMPGRTKVTAAKE